jgi:L-amino acid N-acyltransferase YncA
MFNLREATEGDLSAILTIYNHAIETTTAVFDYRPHTLQMRGEWFHAKQSANLPVVVAVDNDEIVGFATYGPFRAWPAYKYTVEHSVYVASNARRRGVGRTLVREIVSIASRNQMHNVIAGIVSDNLPSLQLHRSLGFVDAGCVHEVGYKFGRWLDLMFLELLLDTPRRPEER